MNPEEIVTRFCVRLEHQVNRVVLGQRPIVQLLAMAMVVGGHVIVEGPPGTAKTLLARTLAGAVGLAFRRIQFTPDLMPSDITGVNVFDRESSSFRFVPGPVFTEVLLADEINRTPPKTQSALLEAMEEHVVTVDGKRYSLSDLFFTIATQNPIEHEGTFPLPEAQLDRFLFRLLISYPERSAETEMITRLSTVYPLHTAELRPSDEQPEDLIRPEEIREARVALRKITLTPTLGDYVARVIAATREHPRVELGASPRAGLHLALAAKVQAALSGRAYVIPDDVKAVAVATLNHRVVLKPDLVERSEGSTEVITEVLAKTSAPSQVIDFVPSSH